MRKIVIVLTLILSSCAQLGIKPITENNQAALKSTWHQHKQELKKIHRWKIKGRIGFRTADNAQSATFRWQQKADKFKILLSGTLGLGSMGIDGTPTYIEFRQTDGQIIRSNNPDSLLQAQTGWNLPISQLSSWLLGYPGNNESEITQLILNESGQLISFNSATWEIKYSKYHLVDDLVLPHKLIIRNEEIKITIIIKTWVLD